MHAAALPLSVSLAVLAAAITHAAWNAIAHGIKDQVLAFGLVGAGSIAASVPLVVLAPFPLAACWPYLLGSVFIHVFYNLLLMRSYRYGQFGQVYPLARGISPLVVTVLAAAFAAERPAPPPIAAVLVVSCGLALPVLAGRRKGLYSVPGSGSGSAPGRAALIAASATGLTIAAYTTVDGLGVRLSGAAAGYIGWLMLLESLCVPAWALARRRDVVVGTSRRVLVSGVTAGGRSPLAFRLVVWGQDPGPPPPVPAPPRASAVIVAVIPAAA